jgi:LysM repeat protein
MAKGGKTHELQPGETLTKIAATYGVTIVDLEKANNITDPTKIRAGTVLTIPPATTAPAPVAAKTTAAAPAAKTSAPAAPAASSIKDSGKIYVVVKGDNPVKIAKRLKVSYANLLSLNGITDPRKLQIGQKLKIPAATTAK